MPSNQLLTKVINVRNFGVAPTPSTRTNYPVKFHLQVGKIARIHGFNVTIRGPLDPLDLLELVIRKNADGEFVEFPTDVLWSYQPFDIPSASYTLPKPYRCSSFQIQAWGEGVSTNVARVIVYYDIDDITKDEDVAILESMKKKGRSIL